MNTLALIDGGGEREMQNTICGASTLVTFDGEERSALEWATKRGLKWQTVRMRRYRGASWEEALRPGLRRTPWMAGWAMSATVERCRAVQ